MKKILIYFLLTLFFGAGLIIGTQYYRKYYGIRETFSISNSLLAIQYNNGKYAIKNETTGKIMSEKYDFVFDTYWWNRDVIVVIKNDLRGYLSAETGEVFIEPQYKYAWINGVNTYLAASVDIFGKLGFIDIRNGKTAIPYQFDCYTTDYGYIEYVFKDNLCKIESPDHKFGLIDTLGNIVLPMQYADIEYRMNNGFIKVTDYAVVDSCADCQLVGLLDFNTKSTVLPIEYEDISFVYNDNEEDNFHIEEYEHENYYEDDEYYGDENTEKPLTVKYIVANRNDTTFVWDNNMKKKMLLKGAWKAVEELESGYIKACDDYHNTCIFDHRGFEVYRFTETF